MRRLTDLVVAASMHASARFTVSYGEQLRFAGSDLPDPERRRIPTRYGTVPVQVYGALGRPTYLHFHGGAWMMRHAAMDDFWCRFLAATIGVTVVNVAVGGFSSGGGLAASVCLQARDLGELTPALQVLGVPALDLAREVEADATGMVSPGLRQLTRRVYFPDEATRREPYASPVLAEDLDGLPPAVVLTAEHDALRSDGVRYAERLRAAGVPVLHDETPGADHYFLTDDLARARQTMTLVATEVRRRLGIGSMPAPAASPSLGPA